MNVESRHVFKFLGMIEEYTALVSALRELEKPETEMTVPVQQFVTPIGEVEHAQMVGKVLRYGFEHEDHAPVEGAMQALKAKVGENIAWHQLMGAPQALSNPVAVPVETAMLVYYACYTGKTDLAPGSTFHFKGEPNDWRDKYIVKLDGDSVLLTWPTVQSFSPARLYDELLTSKLRPALEKIYRDGQDIILSDQYEDVWPKNNDRLSYTKVALMFKKYNELLVGKTWVEFTARRSMSAPPRSLMVPNFEEPPFGMVQPIKGDKLEYRAGFQDMC